jgi:hypothetical protein
MVILSQSFAGYFRHICCAGKMLILEPNLYICCITTEPEIHLGRNIKRLREMLHVTPEALAISLGNDWNQKKVSRLEEREMIEDDLLKEVATALHVTPEAIKNFDEAAAVNIISNTFSDFKDNSVANANYCTFNPVDKIVQLYDEKVALLERLPESEKEKVTMLEKILDKK